MACRIGMTSDLIQRHREWSRTHPTLHSWDVVAGPFPDPKEAREYETYYKQLYGCETHNTGEDIEKNGAKWWVYMFRY